MADLNIDLHGNEPEYCQGLDLVRDAVLARIAGTGPDSLADALLNRLISHAGDGQVQTAMVCAALVNLAVDATWFAATMTNSNDEPVTTQQVAQLASLLFETRDSETRALHDIDPS